MTTLPKATFIWIDMRDSVKTLRRLGIARYAELIQDYFSLANQIVETHGGQIISELGDGFGVVFHQNSSDSAIKMFLDLFQNAKNLLNITVKAGVSYGHYQIASVNFDKAIKQQIYVGVIANASRLETKCRSYKSPLLLSVSAFQKINSPELKNYFKPHLSKTRVKTSLFKKVYLLKKSVL